MAKKSITVAATRTVYADDKKIVFVNKNWRPRAKARTAKIFAALQRSKTVGQFKAAREKMKLSGVGKLFVALLDAKVIKLA